MFWKLCKHELKCSYRGFLILYAITLLLAVMINPSIDSMFVVTLTLIYGLLLCVILIMSMYVIIKNYHTSLPPLLSLVYLSTISIYSSFLRHFRISIFHGEQSYMRYTLC